MAIFTVQPGRSFHSIQQVYATDKPRLSISGWFHGVTPPPGAEHASLAQLKALPTPAHTTTPEQCDTSNSAVAVAVVGAVSAETDVVDMKEGEAGLQPAGVDRSQQGTDMVGKKRAMPDSNQSAIQKDDIKGNIENGGTAGCEAVHTSFDAGFVPLQHDVSTTGAKLSAADKKVLEEWINPLYLQRGSMGSMVAQWEKASCVQLHKFLRQDVAAQACVPTSPCQCLLIFRTPVVGMWQ